MNKSELEVALRDQMRLAYAIGAEIEAIRFRIQTEEIIAVDLKAQLYNNSLQLKAEFAQSVINMLEIKQFIFERRHIKTLVVRNKLHLQDSNRLLAKHIAEKRQVEVNMETTLKLIGQFGKVISL